MFFTISLQDVYNQLSTNCDEISWMIDKYQGYGLDCGEGLNVSKVID